MSDSSESHPPIGMRIQFLCDMLLNKFSEGGLNYRNTLSDSNLNYVEQWRSYDLPPKNSNTLT
jgi:hypothetical protein